jgi:hypothetical protein
MESTMRYIQMRRQAASILLLFLILIASGCGGDAKAPFDATVIGPDDSDFTSTGGGAALVQPLEFQVLDKAGLIALPDVEIELFAGGGGILTDLDGNPLDPNNPTYFKTKTDDRGLTRTSFLIVLPGCGADAVTVTGSVTASVGSASKLWTGTFTIEAC